MISTVTPGTPGFECGHNDQLLRGIAKFHGDSRGARAVLDGETGGETTRSAGEISDEFQWLGPPTSRGSL